MAKYKILHTIVGDHNKGAVVDESALIPVGIDGKPVDNQPVLDRLLGLGAVKVYNSNDDDTDDAPSVESPAGDLAKKLTDDELRAKALDLGLPADQVTKLKRSDLIATIEQAQAQQGSTPAA